MDMHTPTPESAALAATIRAERAARRLSQRAVANSAGMGERTYVRLENDERDMNLAQMVALARVFDLSLAEFMKRVQSRIVR